jgi:hypothetical protein
VLCAAVTAASQIMLLGSTTADNMVILIKDGMIRVYAIAFNIVVTTNVYFILFF